MSNTLKIVTGIIPRHRVYLDDMEVEDVISYSTECMPGGATIATLKIRIYNSVEITHDQEKFPITEQMMEKFRKDAEEWVDRDPKRFKNPELAKKMFVNSKIEQITNP